MGFIVVALVGGAAEMASAFSGARKNRPDLSVGIALGSASQIALFVAPLLVLPSYVIGPTPMDLQLWPGAVVMVLIATLTAVLATSLRGAALHTGSKVGVLDITAWRSNDSLWPVSRHCLFLPRLARGVFGVARGLLILFERCIGLHLGNALGVLPRLFFRDSVCLPGFLSRALCVSQFGGDPVRVFVFGRANFARFCRFDPCGLPLGGLCVVSQRRCPYLFQLGLLRLDRRLQAFRETWFFTRHVFGFSFQSIRIGG